MTGTRAVIAAVALTLALAGCSDDPEPRVADPTPTAPSTTEASGPTPPEMPDAAKGTDAAAAEAFVKFYWEVADYAQQTGDIPPLEELSPDGCKPCRGVIDFLESVNSKGGEIRGGDTEVTDLSSAPVGDGDDLLVVRYTLTNTRQVVDFPGDDDDEEYSPSTVKAESVVRSSGDGWTLEYWGEQP